MIWQQPKRIPIQIVEKKQHKFFNMLYSGTQGKLAMPENDGLLEPAKATWHQLITAMAISKETDRNYLENGFGYFCCYLAPGSLAVPADQKRTKQHSPPGLILEERKRTPRFDLFDKTGCSAIHSEMKGVNYKQLFSK